MSKLPLTADLATLKKLPQLLLAYRKPNTKKAIVQIMSSFGPFFGITGLMYCIGSYQRLPLRTLIPLAILNAFFLVRIFIIQHDCGHQAFLGSTKRNNAIGTISSLFSLIPYNYRAKSHNFHHNHTNKLREYRDIWEILTYSVQEYLQLPKYKQIWYKIFRNPFVMFIIGPLRYLGVTCRLPFIQLKGRGKERRSLLSSNLLMLGLYTALCLLLGRKLFLLTNIATVVAFAIIAIWFFYIQHQYEFGHKEFADKWEYVRAALEGSSFYDLPRFWHWMTGNIGYHHIHHLNPTIPCYELANCFNENPLLQQLARRLTFTESLQCLRCHLWDEHQQKMISFASFRKKYLKKKH